MDAATMENGKEIPENFYKRIIKWYSISTPGYLLEENKNSH